MLHKLTSRELVMMRAAYALLREVTVNHADECRCAWCIATAHSWIETPVGVFDSVDDAILKGQS